MKDDENSGFQFHETKLFENLFGGHPLLAISYKVVWM